MYLRFNQIQLPGNKENKKGLMWIVIINGIKAAEQNSYFYEVVIVPALNSPS